MLIESWLAASGAGAAYGRPVRFNGITISRMEDGLVVDGGLTTALIAD
jgi:hypothetical protein